MSLARISLSFWRFHSCTTEDPNLFTIYLFLKAVPITGVWGPEGSGRLRLQTSRPSAHEGGKVVTPTHRLPLLPGISRYSFLEAVRPQGTRKCQLPQNKFQVSPLGIDPGSYRLVAQRLNHYATPDRYLFIFTGFKFLSVCSGHFRHSSSTCWFQKLSLVYCHFQNPPSAECCAC